MRKVSSATSSSPELNPVITAEVFCHIPATWHHLSTPPANDADGCACEYSNAWRDGMALWWLQHVDVYIHTFQGKHLQTTTNTESDTTTYHLFKTFNWITVTTNVIQIVSKHWIGQILVLTFQRHKLLHINLVFCNICRDATKCLRRDPFSSESIFCLEPPCSKCDVHYFGWSKLISTNTNLQKPSPSPYSVFFLILLHGCQITWMSKWFTNVQYNEMNSILFDVTLLNNTSQLRIHNAESIEVIYWLLKVKYGCFQK